MAQTPPSRPSIRYNQTNRPCQLAIRNHTLVRPMPEFVVVTTTSGDHTVAEQIAADLVDRRLVACAQIAGPVKSVYRWKGTVEFTEEVVLQLKTVTQNIPAIKETIASLHPYDVPEVIVTPIVDGSDAYLEWLRSETREA